MQQACVPELEHMKTWHPDPDIRGLGGGGDSLKKIFRPFRPQFGLKISRGGGGAGSTGAATVYELSVVDARLSPRLNTFSFHGG